jgi:hypothetical protein
LPMFEDSMMESAGKIKTKSRYWMIGTFVLNGTIVAALAIDAAREFFGSASGNSSGTIASAATIVPFRTKVPIIQYLDFVLIFPADSIMESSNMGNPSMPAAFGSRPGLRCDL